MSSLARPTSKAVHFMPWLGVAFAVAAILFVAYKSLEGVIFYPTYSSTYRLEVAVNTPEGRKTSFSVLDVDIVDMRNSWWPYGRQISTRVDGEAVSFVLGDGRVLFATLCGIAWSECKALHSCRCSAGTSAGTRVL